MNFDLDDTQQEISRLAADVFGRTTSQPRLESTEATPERFDRELWAELARTGLLGVAIAEEHGGLGLGVVELALVCEQLGRAVAPVPLVAACTTAWLLNRHGSPEQQARWLPAIASGDTVVAVAPRASALRIDRDGGSVSGELVGVPWAHVADAVLVDSESGPFLLDPGGEGVSTQPGTTTGGERSLDLRLDGVEVAPVGDTAAAALLRATWLVAWAAVQAGVTDAALRLTADYTSRREQFGKPLSTFQGVALKAADAYVDARVIRAAALQAAWSLDNGDDAVLPVVTAAWWAAEGGQHCVHITQHLHGGMGADVTYPAHRYYLWGKQIELLVGGASSLLAELGDALAARPDAGDALVLG
jgi:3-oxocholest-4-en-26-oyl-CoA dehydrogenase beta subunit